MSRCASMLSLSLLFAVGAHAAPAKCIFGESLNDLFENKTRFATQHDVIRTFKLGRMKGSNKEPIMVEVSIVKDKQTGRVFHVNQTFQDRYDGGNVVGWIEDVTNAEHEASSDTAGDVVSEISDGDLYPCNLTE